MPKLRTLDGQEVTHIDKVEADVLFGHDLMNKKEIFLNYLPEEEFIDRRIFVSEQIDPESDSDEDRETMENLENARLIRMSQFPNSSKNITLSTINEKRTGNIYDNTDLAQLASVKLHSVTR